MALILVGLLLIYAGIKGRSVTGLLTGRSEPSKAPAPVTR
jgi:hypothetical protein